MSINVGIIDQRARKLAEDLPKWCGEGGMYLQPGATISPVWADCANIAGAWLKDPLPVEEKGEV